MVDGAWLTLEGRSAIEARRLEGLFLECGSPVWLRPVAARWVVVHVRRLSTLTSGPAALPPKEEE
jgi:hypothetical protein